MAPADRLSSSWAMCGFPITGRFKCRSEAANAQVGRYALQACHRAGPASHDDLWAAQHDHGLASSAPSWLASSSEHWGASSCPASRTSRAGLTIVVGIVAALIGTFIARFLGVAETRGFDWIELIIQIVLAAGGVILAANLYARRGIRR